MTLNFYNMTSKHIEDFQKQQLQGMSAVLFLTSMDWDILVTLQVASRAKLLQYKCLKSGNKSCTFIFWQNIFDALRSNRKCHLLSFCRLNLQLLLMYCNSTKLHLIGGYVNNEQYWSRVPTLLVSVTGIRAQVRVSVTWIRVRVTPYPLCKSVH